MIEPSEGACYRLRFDELARTSNDNEPVPCREPHNAQTFHVGRLDTVVEGRRVGVHSRAVRNQVSTACSRRLGRFVGGTLSDRALSRFHAVWFTPTVAEFARGANWFRCDVIAFAGSGRLADLPRPARLRGVLDGPRSLDRYGLCGTAAPGGRHFERVICSRRHSWQAVSTIRIDGGHRYPGVRAVRRAGEDTCRERVRALSDSALRFRYGWEWPTREQWDHGQHYGFCWAPD